MAAYLSIENLTVSYGSTRVLDRVSLDVERGEMVALLGSSGCGKTTLLRSIAGFVMPDSGAIRVNGLALSQFSRVEIARRRAYLPQNPRCEWPISVERPAIPAPIVSRNDFLIAAITGAGRCSYRVASM